MVMGFKISLIFLAVMLIFLQFLPFSIGQLSPSETRIMFQVQKILEYPPAFQGWNNWTNFCVLPPSPSLVIVCSNNHIAELTVTGNKIPKPKSGNSSISSQTLSNKFSIDSFFTVLTKLPSLKVLSLVSLGLWGPLPPKINRFKSLQVLNLSSNFINGEIPTSVSTMVNLKILIMGDNLFNGSVPDLRKLQFLEEVDLGNNHLGPEFPKLGTNLVSIKLGNNSMRSDIPLELIGFDQLQFLDVSFNKLVGPIPSSLFSLPSIAYISLAKNQFSGALSANISCNEKLRFVDISNNLLMGKLPSCFRSNRKVVDLWNCLSNGTSKYQHAYSFCHKEALAVKPPIGDQKGEESSGKLGLILGIIGGTVVAAGAFVLLILVIVRRSDKKKKASSYKCDSFVFEKGSVRGSTSPAIDGRRVKSTMRMVSLGIPPYHVFTLEEIEDATNNFDTSYLVGEGSQGQIYKGRIRDGTVVLVKCLKLKQKYSPQILQQHMEVISQLRHRHLVSVIGHCIVTYQDHPNAGSTAFIVLEHVSNGSLREHLTDWRKREFLKWPQRMGITMGIARGIQFLHSGIAPGIFGNDLKIDDILLDDSLSAKISSYNMSLPSKVGAESPLNGQAAGSSRFDSTENAKKDDIYQFGIILLQVITGKPGTSEGELDQLRFELERRLAEAPTTLREMTDPVSRGTFAYDSLKTIAQITVNCLCAETSRRPSIEDVMWHMQYAMQVQEGWNSSGNLSTSKLSGQLNNIS